MKIVKQNKYTKIKNKDKIKTKKEAKQQLEKYQKHYMLALNQNITLFIYLKKMEQCHNTESFCCLFVLNNNHFYP